MKNGKAAGKDRAVPEMVKADGDILIEEIICNSLEWRQYQRNGTQT